MAAMLATLGFTPASAQEKYDGLNVMSFNIRTDVGKHKDGTNSWEYRWKCATGMIEDVHPDIIGLQELTAYQLLALQDECRDYGFKGAGRDDGKRKGEMTGIMWCKKNLSLVKWGYFWLNENQQKKPVKGWDAKYPRTCTWGLFKSKKSGKKFYFFNTHLDHKGSKAKEMGLKLICEKIAAMNTKNLPVVLTGDFNLRPDNPAMKGLDGSGLQDARTSADRTDDHISSHGWGKQSEIIDYIFYKGFSACPMFKTLTKTYPDEAGEPHPVSDHYPIITCLIF
ncbi:MAG: endonuclease/exonuclease/phosphatase family protein [Bacteroidales bacterium]|nr:endonuclease/exonuclease/phosphatase family protein [Bacteroidales bacterium]